MKVFEIKIVFNLEGKLTTILIVNKQMIEQDFYYLGLLENKTPFEKKLNIIATSNYFAKKKDYYVKSNIQMTKEIGNLKIYRWGLDQIVERCKNDR